MKKAKYKLQLKKDDIVEVIAGKEKGKKGKVLAIYPARERVTVEKLNMVKRHTKGDGKSRQSAIIEKEGTIHISNVLLKFCYFHGCHDFLHISELLYFLWKNQHFGTFTDSLFLTKLRILHISTVILKF